MSCSGLPAVVEVLDDAVRPWAAAAAAAASDALIVPAPVSLCFQVV
jgi:hypothetical protein